MNRTAYLGTLLNTGCGTVRVLLLALLGFMSWRRMRLQSMVEDGNRNMALPEHDADMAQIRNAPAAYR
ncbi:hypothetical protein [Pseudacidovorax sp. RU35E]|jgi:hypothetical protein|uniref:hypothetical protein n=1 Tax=Pseudacidovorax sp. RU35E TaxID=1907403 RepID=UPI00095533EA|nr:hypothetical protein [Pseudacidovorax sp. RU35E]SIR51121.1 hypothetical protein SAMN05880557_112101 [Pseudacidovorax sp. RU35E]